MIQETRIAVPPMKGVKENAAEISFCVTDEAVSAQMGSDRVQDFLRHGAEYIASADMSCLLHLKGIIDRGQLPLKVIHIAQILNGAHE